MLHNLFQFNAAHGDEPDRIVTRSFCGIDDAPGMMPGQRMPPGEQCPDCGAVCERMVAAEHQLDRAFAVAKHNLLLSFVHGGAPSDKGYSVIGEDGRALVSTNYRPAQAETAQSAERS